MKKFMLFIVSVMALQVLAVEPQDIVLKTRLDPQSSATFIKRIRTFMIHNNLGDPYNGHLDAPIVVDFNQMVHQLPQDTQSWIKEFQALLNLKVFDSVYKLRVERFAYSIESFNSELFPMSSDQGRINYVTANYVHGLRLSADKIAFQVELNRTTSGEPIKFDIELIRPEFILHPDLVIELPMGWQTILVPDALALTLDKIDLSKVISLIVEKPQLVDLAVKEVKMPQVNIRIGNRQIIFDKEKIVKFILSRKDDMKMAIMDLLKTRGTERFANIIKDKPQEVFLPRIYTATGTLNAAFDMKEMHAAPDTRMIEIKMDGHFCSSANEMKEDYCRSREITAKVRRQITPAIFADSMHEIDNLILQKKANLAISVSEHYLNQLVNAAADAGVFELNGDNFKLGSEKAFVLAEEQGPGFNLYLDIIYKLKGSQRILVGRSELRFPVRLNIGLKIVTVQDIPHLQITVLGLKTDSALLLKGVPQYGLTTNVNSVRFQKKVVDSILEDIKPFEGKMLVDVELKEFAGTYLEKLNFYSDGRGRATAILFVNQ